MAMKRRQTRLPRQWLIADDRMGADLLNAVSALPRGSGVLVLFRDRAGPERRKILQQFRRVAAAKGLMIADEGAGAAARVHNLPQLRRALLARVSLILLSPVFPTRSHPDWIPLPRMRAAAYARLARRRLIALGGMNERRFAQLEALGFQAWAGIDAWRQSRE
jgi:thiamine-phosphate pyrophosphorylase